MSAPKKQGEGCESGKTALSEKGKGMDSCLPGAAFHLAKAPRPVARSVMSYSDHP